MNPVHEETCVRQRCRAWGWAVLGLLVTLLVPAPGSAGEMEAPAEGQVLVFLKVLTYDRALALPDRDAIRITVLYATGNRDSEANRDAVLRALAANSGKTVNGRAFEFAACSYESSAKLSQHLADEGVHVLYVTRGLGEQLRGITAAARRRGVLTMTGVPGFVAQGISVGMVVRDDQPRIMLNLPAVKAEGHDMNANLLRLCEVIR
jgi:hypothetical protein